MANERIWIEGTKLTLAATGTTTSISDGAFQECTDDNRQPTDNAGYPMGKFELTLAAGGYSAVPTAGAVYNIYEQRINSGASDAPDVDANYKHIYIGSLYPDIADSQQYLSDMFPIWLDGGKYWVEWLDGGSGTASVDAGWKLEMTPLSEGN